MAALYFLFLIFYFEQKDVYLVPCKNFIFFIIITEIKRCRMFFLLHLYEKDIRGRTS